MVARKMSSHICQVSRRVWLHCSILVSRNRRYLISSTCVNGGTWHRGRELTRKSSNQLLVSCDKCKNSILILYLFIYFNIIIIDSRDDKNMFFFPLNTHLIKNVILWLSTSNICPYFIYHRVFPFTYWNNIKDSCLQY